MKKIWKGIDISKHNTITDWDQVAQNVDFVIMRAGGNYDGFYKDSKFERNYDACKLRNIPVGAYYDCGKKFMEADFGKRCAQHFIRLLSGKQFEYPIYMDIEVTPAQYKKYITEASVAFCSEMEEAGFYAGIYASDISGFKERLILEKVKQFTFWVARYGAQPSYVKKYAIWQHSSKGSIPGIKGPVDLDTSFVDFEKAIRGCHLNGY